MSYQERVDKYIELQRRFHHWTTSRLRLWLRLHEQEEQKGQAGAVQLPRPTELM